MGKIFFGNHLSKETFRNEFTYAEFSAFCLRVKQLPILIFPFLLGSQSELALGEHAFALGGYTELSGYAGIFSIVLSAIALMTYRNRLTLFWAFVALISIIFALGGSLPWLAELIYHVPVLNKFRVPARHLYEYGLAISVLAGLGVSALKHGEMNSVQLKKMTKVIIIFFIILITLTFFSYTKKVPVVDYKSLLNFVSNGFSPVIYVPIIWMLLSVLILFLYIKSNLGFKKEWLILLIVMLDMTSFGWFHDWRFSSVGYPEISQKEIFDKYNILVKQSLQKLVSRKGEALPSDSARLYGIRSLNWYGPMMLKRYSEVTGINTSGVLDTSAILDSNVGLDIFSGRYLFIEPPDTMKLHGIPWRREPLDWALGNGCGSKYPKQHIINLPAPVPSNRLAIVTLLGCSTNFANEEPVGTVILHGDDGHSESVILRAGIDTAEWAADCDDVIPMMHHHKAVAFKNWRNIRPDNHACDAHTYLSQSSFPSTRVTSIEINAQENVVLSVIHITLSDSHVNQR